jgi:anti-sigma factor RsiW
VSLSLDGELSELERRLLETHIGRCTSCHEFAAELSGLVQGMRSTPLDPVPAGARASTAGWRRRTTAPVRVAGRAAAVAAAAAAGLAMFSLGAESVSPAGPERATTPIVVDAGSMSDTMTEIEQFRDVRRAQLLSVDTNDGEAHSGTQPL